MPNIIGRRKLFLSISGALLALSLIFLAVFGLKSGIDFSAGSLLTVAFDSPPALADLRSELSNQGYSTAIVQETGSQDFIIRLPTLTDAEKNSLEDGLEASLGTLTERGFETVDPVIASQTSRIALIAVALAAVGILLYLTYAFRRMPKPLHYGTGAVIAVLHDVLAVLGIYAALAAAFGWEINLVFIIGILAVIGYSVNNTVVVFDRIRENKLRGVAPTFEGVVNRSVSETLVRSLNTSLTTIIVVLALMLFVGATIQNLAAVMLIGIIVGTYDSVFVAPAILVIWDNFDKSRLAPKVSRATSSRMNAKSRAAALSVGSNTVLIILKVTVGLATGAVSILAEAIHSALDLVAAVIAFFGVRAADKPADREHPFGHGKWENVSGTIEALLIFIAAVWIIYEAVKRILHGAEVELLGWGMAVMLVSVIANTIVSRHLFKTAKATDSIALEADGQHLRTDIMTSAGVLAGLALVQITGLKVLDPVVAMAVALIIIKAAYDILKKSFGDIVDTGLPPEDEKIINDIFKDHRQQLVSFHGLRTRKAGAQRFAELHVVMPRDITVEKSHQICDHLEADLKKRLPRLEITLHVEPCDDDCPECDVSCDSRKSPAGKSRKKVRRVS